MGWTLRTGPGGAPVCYWDSLWARVGGVGHTDQSDPLEVARLKVLASLSLVLKRSHSALSAVSGSCQEDLRELQLCRP